MRNFIARLFSLVIFCSAAFAGGGATLPDLAKIRGFNYIPSSAHNDIEFWRDYDRARVERELDYAAKLQLNQTRVFLNYVVYEREPEEFLDRVLHFVRAAHARQIGTMIVVWDQCCLGETPRYDVREAKWYPNPDPKHIAPDFWPAGDRCARDLVKTLSDEPGLAFWDITNAPAVAKQPEVREFVRHYARLFKELDRKTPITISGGYLDDMEAMGDLVDVLSYHDYSSTRAEMAAKIRRASEMSSKFNKPMMATEIGCVGRANPYDIAIETYMKEKIGWYVWELMITRFEWGKIHGVFYPDGTVRDPSIAASILGFFRNRGPNIVPAVADQEGWVTRVTENGRKWLSNPNPSWNEGLDLAETAANLLESGELVPMREPPTRQVELIRRGQPDLSALRALLRTYIETLEPYRKPK